MAKGRTRNRASRPVVRWDGAKRAAVVSDLHLGSSFSRSDAFAAWLESLPRDLSLALNGDILDDVRRELRHGDRKAWTRLIEASLEREVVWVLGNHDDDLPWDQVGGITIARHLEVGRRLLVIHGDYFDDVMPRSRIFVRIFERLHSARLRLGAPHVHVAQYAKRWRAFYKVLNDNVMKNAAASAKRNGFEAVVCGHTHYPMDIMCNGIRYLNTGAWTEEPLHYLEVQDGIQMRAFR